MALPSIMLSTSVSLLVSLSTSFSTIYHTSTPVAITTLTSAATHLTTLTLPETVMASTLAIPTTITQTISSIFTSYAPGAPAASTEPPPAASAETITTTSTTTSIFVQAGQTVTYYPPTHTAVLTPPPTYTVVEPTSTVTFTEIIFLLEDPSGQVYSTITTALPPRASRTGPIVFVAGDGQGDGWDTWSDAQKGGLIAGVVLLFLLILGILAFCLLRRRNIWLANEWMGARAPVMVQPQMAGAVVPYQQQNGQWGYGL